MEVTITKPVTTNGMSIHKEGTGYGWDMPENGHGDLSYATTGYSQGWAEPVQREILRSRLAQSRTRETLPYIDGCERGYTVREAISAGHAKL